MNLIVLDLFLPHIKIFLVKKKLLFEYKLLVIVIFHLFAVLLELKYYQQVTLINYMLTKELIIDTATRLFLKNGVKTVTIDRLVKELHTSKRTIYTHFNDKTALLKACLAVYHARIKEENEEIIASADNAIEAMAYLHQRIVRRASIVNPNFFNDILHYHPGLLNESYRKTGNFAHQELYDLAKWGISDGLFLSDMDIEVTAKTVLALLKLLKDNDEFPVSVFSKERLTWGIMLPYLRGLCTPKELNILEMHEELFRVSI